MSDKHPLNDDGKTAISPWIPERDPVIVAALGKMAEELSECAGRAARSIIQGLDGVDPDTGNTNDYELAREMADVYATFHAFLGVATQVPDMVGRRLNKTEGFRRWFNMIRDHEDWNPIETIPPACSVYVCRFHPEDGIWVYAVYDNVGDLLHPPSDWQFWRHLHPEPRQRPL